MENIRYYLSIFLRRLPWFLVVATIISAIAVTVALTLPPAYESRTQLIVERPQIPEELAASTVQTDPVEQLRLLEQRLLTRENMLDIARRLEVLPDLNRMNPDQIVEAMRARTTMDVPRGGRDSLPVMSITFEAPEARTAAAVLNEYLTLIQRQDTEFRRGRAGETLNYFEQEVDRLGQEVEAQSARILQYKQANQGALPDSLEYRLGQQTNLQEQLSQITRDISAIRRQSEQLIRIYEATGQVGGAQQAAASLSPEQKRLQDMRAQLDEALLIYSEENPRVKLLRARIAELEAKIGAAVPSEEGQSSGRPPVLNIQLAELESRANVLEEQKEDIQTRLEGLEKSINETPEVSISLEEMQRKYDSLQAQYNQAEDRLAQARTGERIETRSRGQRISVIEQPAVPSQPTKPNRVLIAGGGTAFGILAGIGLILLIELLNNTPRRPEDLVKRFNITPLTTLPYVRTRRQLFTQRSIKVLIMLVILTGIPAAIYAVHVYYLPLDLLADRVMNKLGVRW